MVYNKTNTREPRESRVPIVTFNTREIDKNLLISLYISGIKLFYLIFEYIEKLRIEFTEGELRF